MTRRGFLSLLGAAAVTVTDPERLLWMPGKKPWKDGVSMRFIKTYNPHNEYLFVTGLDTLYGYPPYRSEFRISQLQDPNTWNPVEWTGIYA